VVQALGAAAGPVRRRIMASSTRVHRPPSPTALRLRRRLRCGDVSGWASPSLYLWHLARRGWGGI